MASFLSGAPASGGDRVILQQPSGPQRCEAEASHPRLRLGPGVAALPADPRDRDAIEVFLAVLVSEQNPVRGSAADALRWLRDPFERSRVLRGRVLLRSFRAGDQHLAVLRLPHSAMTCGSGGCATPVLVASGCKQVTGLACLQAARQTRRLQILYGDTLLIAQQAEEALIQASACNCSGPLQCSARVTLWRVDGRDARLRMDARR